MVWPACWGLQHSCTPRPWRPRHARRWPCSCPCTRLQGLYAAPQVLVGQAVGAEYAAPYLGRMNDAYGGDQVQRAGNVRVLRWPARSGVACFGTTRAMRRQPCCPARVRLVAPHASCLPCLPPHSSHTSPQGEKAVVEMQRILDSNQSRMRLLVASIRDSAEMTRLAAAVGGFCGCLRVFSFRASGVDGVGV